MNALAADGARLRECLNGLDHRHRSFIVLAFMHGLSHSQVAARLDMPLGTVKTWRLLLGSGVVRPGPGSWAEGIWCASKSGSS